MQDTISQPVIPVDTDCQKLLFLILAGESKIQASQNKFTRLVGCGIKSMGPIFKTKMLIYQSKANLNVKILFGKITHYLDPEIRKVLVLVNGKFGNEIPHSILDSHTTPLRSLSNCWIVKMCDFTRQNLVI